MEEETYSEDEIQEAVKKLNTQVEAKVVERPGVLVDRYINVKETIESLIRKVEEEYKKATDIAKTLETEYGIRVSGTLPAVQSHVLPSTITTSSDPEIDYTPVKTVSVEDIRHDSMMSGDTEKDFAGSISSALQNALNQIK